MLRPLNILLAVLFSIAIILPNATHAGDWIKQGDEWLTISGGVFISKINSTVSVDNSSLGAGAGVDLEDDLDLGEDATTFWGDVTWRRVHVSKWSQFGRSCFFYSNGIVIEDIGSPASPGSCLR